MNTPKGYVALRNSYDGKTILVDARGLYVAPRPSEGGSKETCCVASVYYDDTGWTIAESFDEVCAKLAAALGEQTPPAAPDLSALERAVVEAADKWRTAFGEFVEADVAEMEGRVAWQSPIIEDADRRREAAELALVAAVRALRAARGGA